jgi:hypothetical protein
MKRARKWIKWKKLRLNLWKSKKTGNVKFIKKVYKIFKSTEIINRSAFFIMILAFLYYPETSISQFLNSSVKLNSKLSEISSDSLKKKSSEKVIFKMKKDPWKAVLYSALLPGAGQIYNHSYWKVPVIVGLGGYFIYGYINNNNQYIDYQNLYSESQTPENPTGNPQYQYLREFYRDQRDNFIVYSLILYLVNLIDAYVDAQLYDFDVSDNIKVGLLKQNKLMKLSYEF